ncbi:MAG TPA: ATP-binding protein [Myxococcota bacterium]|nr:ATP-binding protein [Myxococcota bacterium]HKK92704.1 ATP-binding protein [Longimicrobiales bacterium]
MRNDLVLEIPSDPSAIEHAVELVVRRCENSDCCRRRLELNFRVGLMEALANAVFYGNREDPEKCIRLEIAILSHAIEARVTDEGNGFDPEEVPDPTMPENIQRPGGRGLFLMRKLMDEVYFNDAGNSVTLVLHLETPAPLDEVASA